MPFFDIEFRRPILEKHEPQDKVVKHSWRKIKNFYSDFADKIKALREFKMLVQDYMGFEPETNSICESEPMTPVEKLGSML